MRGWTEEQFPLLEGGKGTRTVDVSGLAERLAPQEIGRHALGAEHSGARVHAEPTKVGQLGLRGFSMRMREGVPSMGY